MSHLRMTRMLWLWHWKSIKTYQYFCLFWINTLARERKIAKSQVFSKSLNYAAVSKNNAVRHWMIVVMVKAPETRGGELVKSLGIVRYGSSGTQHSTALELSTNIREVSQWPEGPSLSQLRIYCGSLLTIPPIAIFLHNCPNVLSYRSVQIA